MRGCAGLLTLAHQQYNSGRYKDALVTCEQVYQTDAHRTDNLLLLGAIHFQQGNFSECIFYNQQAIRIDPSFAGACVRRLGVPLCLTPPTTRATDGHASLLQRLTGTWATR